MNRSTISACFAALFLSPVSSLASAQDDAELIDRGNRLVQRLAGEPREFTNYFEIQFPEGMDIGYVIAELKLRKEGDQTYYEYSTDTIIRSAADAQLAVSIRGKLKSDFEPTEIEQRRVQTAPQRKKIYVHQRLIFGVDTFTIVSDDGTQQTSVDKPLPKRPFIYAILFLVQRLQLANEQPFVVNEFSLPALAAEPIRFHVQKWTDEKPTIIAKFTEVEGGYQFWFSDDGRLERWMISAMPFLFVARSKERMKELMSSYGKVEDLVKESDRP